MQIDQDDLTDQTINLGKHCLRKEHTFEGKFSVIIAALSFGIIFALFFQSWLMYFFFGPILWFGAIIFGAIAVIKDDNLGFAGMGLAYIIFLGNVSLLFLL